MTQQMVDYQEFVRSKMPRIESVGHPPDSLSPVLYDFQAALTDWACRKGRAAIWADCGLGKTLMQLEWARQMRKDSTRALIVAPLGVIQQTEVEAKKLGMTVVPVREPTDDSYQIVNYQKLHHFIGAAREGWYSAIVLDESSILKSLDGKTRTMLIREFSTIPYRLCCTATPAPNDISEIGNHSEFLGAMSRAEMMASFFVHDSDKHNGGAEWRLKGYAASEFWRWVSSWGMFLTSPSDLGFSAERFRLPDLMIREVIVRSNWVPDGQLFAAAQGIRQHNEARRNSIAERTQEVARMIQARTDQVLVWCGLNDEGRVLAGLLGDSCGLIEGSTDDDEKVALELAWRSGKIQTLITKPSIFGFGLNWQHCHRVIFLGIGYSYEQYYQAMRRCWRFGQKKEVDVAIVVSESEIDVASTVRRKETEAKTFAREVVAHMADSMKFEIQTHGEGKDAIGYETDEAHGDGWTMLLGDCVERIKEVPDASVGLSVFSPPFASLYTYSASPRDMGNSRTYDEFFQHFGMLIPELVRVTMPGRRCCVHVQQVTTTKATHGVIGWRDFRADVVKAFTAEGWVYDGEVVIDKDPQAQAIRTKSKALMFVQKNKDSAWSRPAMADYILLFRASGENPEPVETDVSNEEWILWARPIWYGIRESDTLNAREARTEKDEKHIAPLQLETIERCIRLWSNPGDTILSPFAGIGSEGYVAVQFGRRFVGIELKPEYWQVARKNLRNAQPQIGLFDVPESQEAAS